MLAFLQSSFPPQVPVKLRVPVCRPFTLNTRTHIQKHPYQRRWRPGTPRADWRAAWGMNSPTQMCSVLPQAESPVFLCAWQHICIIPQFLYDSFKQEVMFVIFIHHVVCVQMRKTSGSPQTFTLSIFLSLAVKLGWSWKGGRCWKSS